MRRVGTTWVSVADLVRRYHLAAASFDPSGYQWPRPIPARFRTGLVSHNDVHPANLVFRGGRAVALIDFDLAGPGSAIWDFAAAARYWAPLQDERDVTDSRRGRALERFRIFLQASGLRRADRRRVAEAVVANHDWTYAIVTEAARPAIRASPITGAWSPSRPPGPGAGASGISVTCWPPHGDLAGNRRVQRMITVAGEALIDLIVDPAGHVDPRLGGGPFNVTRAVARLGLPAAFLGRLSGDRFGQLMRADLDRHGVLVAVEAPTGAPTTLALVDVDPAGVPGYHFYLAGTSAAAIGPGEAVLPEGTTALHVGSLGLVMEPVGTSTEQLVTALPDGITVMLDPNCRPGAIASRQAYLDRLDRMLRRVDVLKTSTEDLAYLFPGQDAGPAAAELLGRGPACVLVTDGAAPVRAFTAGFQIRADVPAAPVVDTVGAGDAFGGAFLTWWIGNGLGRAELGDPELIRGATQAAILASVVTCTHRGAEPPWADELAGHDGWRWLPPAEPRPAPESQAVQG